MKTAPCAVLLSVGGSLAGAPAWAGRSCEPAPLDMATVQQALQLAEHTAHRLDERGAQVVLIARKGQDLSAYGVTWSHVAFAYRDASAATGPALTARWRVVHKLNECGTARGDLYRQGLGEFFLDRLWRYEAAVVVLAPEVQARLLPVLRDNRAAAAWQSGPYSMVAYPWAQIYQQSNQWAIETLAGSMLMAEQGAGASADAGRAPPSRRDAQAWLREQGFRPTTLHVGPLERLGARVGTANVAFDDHPAAQRFGDRIDTVTADAVLQWLQRSGLGREVIELR